MTLENWLAAAGIVISLCSAIFGAAAWLVRSITGLRSDLRVQRKATALESKANAEDHAEFRRNIGELWGESRTHGEQIAGINSHLGRPHAVRPAV